MVVIIIMKAVMVMKVTMRMKVMKICILIYFCSGVPIATKQVKNCVICAINELVKIFQFT